MYLIAEGAEATLTVNDADGALDGVQAAGDLVSRDRNTREAAKGSEALIPSARELGCGGDPAAFDRMFQRIAPPMRKPQDRRAEAETRGRRPGRAERSEGGR